ncbi:uncharacterized protein LOC117901882 [Drosophila subobscura]|uniref:uncharacterized protein LOC117901882 n=1 Tax=Drosophila subobscura TaxID=7241 RepID=UPI00155A8CB3|nr:uncharacterized protein LOC117901882 [Drosophila subobscura]
MSRRDRAYAQAEERWLDIIASRGGVSVEQAQVGPGPLGVEAANEERAHFSREHNANEQQLLDPAVDSLLHVISDDSEICSLISSDGTEFHGWPDKDDPSTVENVDHGVYGLIRTISQSQGEDLQAAHYSACTPPKRARMSCEIIEINDSPEAATDSGVVFMQSVSTNPGVLLTNGSLVDSHLFEILPHSEEQALEMVDPSGTEQCVVYEDVDGEIVLAEEHCCEIIVSTQNEQAYLMSGNGALLRHHLNGSGYIDGVAGDEDEEETRMEAGNNVYLSDAALDQPMVHHHELVEEDEGEDEEAHNDNEHENANFVDDTPLEEERPDICQVYDHELEDHDNEGEEEDNIQQDHHHHQLPLEQELPLEHVPEMDAEQPIVISDIEEEQPEHSSPTQFPNSSSSTPNGSDNYDYDDDLGLGEDDRPRKMQPAKRKYPPLLKNTLFAEAMDRRLATICQAQPQMSLSEKVATWEMATTHDCEAVEDVENFQANFEQHEASMASKHHSFNEFRETLERNMEKINRQFMRSPAQSTVDHGQASPSQGTSAQEKPLIQRRQLHVLHTEDTIVLDDDEDDCYEVGGDNPSVVTLTPEVELQALTSEQEEELQQQQEEKEEEPKIVPDMKTIQTQTSVQRLATKETSTADLAPLPVASVTTASAESPAPAAAPEAQGMNDMPPAIISTETAADRELVDVVFGMMGKKVTKQQQELLLEQQHSRFQESLLPPFDVSHGMRAGLNAVAFGDCPNDAMFYEQQEFCNYLGLTEMSTANAVATAMRELANSTVARRSLRVRPQEQLDRMRSDVRGKRKERKQQLQQLQQNVALNTSSEQSTEEQGTAAAAEEQRQSTHEYDQYYGAQGDHPVASDAEDQESEDKNADNRCLKSDLVDVQVFAQIYAAPTPTQDQLVETLQQQNLKRAEDNRSEVVRLECMQKRLRQARESKPSIYIVEAMSNAPPEVLPESSPKQRARARTLTSSPTRIVETTSYDGPRPSLESSSPDRSQLKYNPKLTKNQAQTSKAPRKSQPESKKPRTSTGAATTTKTGAPARIRDLVTRSTTHMNSKLLRNRKVNLLKSYALTDAAAQGKGKRLSGGTAARAAAKQSAKGNAKKPPEPTNTQEKKLPQQHRLEQQQTAPATPPHTPTKTAARATNALTVDAGVTLPKSTRRARAQTLPEAGTKASVQIAAGPLPAAHLSSSMHVTADPLQIHGLMDDSQGFFENHAPISPAKDLVGRYMLSARQFAKQQEPQELYMQANPSGYSQYSQTNSSNYAHAHAQAQAQYASVAKPALIYPPMCRAEVGKKEPEKEPHFSRRRPSQQTETSGLYTEINRALPPGGMVRLSDGSRMLSNPLAGKHGKVLYIYYELDQLIVLQEHCVSFWKYSKVFNVLHKPRRPNSSAAKETGASTHSILPGGQGTEPRATESERSHADEDFERSPRWVNLGKLRRITNDTEVFAPFGNRLCVHNSTPVYVEMRCHPLDHHKREVTLTSLHVNIYYYCEEELRPKMHSVHLDAVSCDGSHVIFTSITESRYFVVAWQQEVVMGKPRSGICKYSLTPTLDTLASIREFKQLRHELKHIECLTEDRLIGYGQTRITIWDHRSGDTLMNYDLCCQLGRSLTAMHYPSFELDQSSILILYQHIESQEQSDMPSEVHVIACELSHTTPSHRLLQVHRLPAPQFNEQLQAVNTGDHLILKAITGDEIWISSADPRQLTYVAPQGNGSLRFYARHKSQVIEMAPRTLTVDSIANHMLQLAVQQQQQIMNSSQSPMSLAASILSMPVPV